MSMAARIEDKLRAAFAPVKLTVIDDSRRHAGHAGARPGGETHFRVEIVAAAFAGHSRVDRHRLINAALAEELADRVHALELKVRAPDEDQSPPV